MQGSVCSCLRFSSWLDAVAGHRALRKAGFRVARPKRSRHFLQHPDGRTTVRQHLSVP
jgi:predicted RNA binding protein YcfA (HicA-like mRNA interferase family)